MTKVTREQAHKLHNMGHKIYLNGQHKINNFIPFNSAVDTVKNNLELRRVTYYTN